MTKYFEDLHEASLQKGPFMKKMELNGFSKEEINLAYGNCWNLLKDYGEQKIDRRRKAEQIISFRRR